MVRNFFKKINYKKGKAFVRRHFAEGGSSKLNDTSEDGIYTPWEQNSCRKPFNFHEPKQNNLSNHLNQQTFLPYYCPFKKFRRVSADFPPSHYLRSQPTFSDSSSVAVIPVLAVFFTPPLNPFLFFLIASQFYVAGSDSIIKYLVSLRPPLFP